MSLGGEMRWGNVIGGLWVKGDMIWERGVWLGLNVMRRNGKVGAGMSRIAVRSN